MSSTELSVSTNHPLSQFSPYLKMHLELSAYKDMLEIQCDLNAESINLNSKALSLYCHQLSKVEYLLQRLHKQPNTNFIPSTSNEETQWDRLQYGIAIRIFQETSEQSTQPMLKAILADLKKNHPISQSNSRPVELFDFKWFIMTTKSEFFKNDMISYIISEERSPYYVKETITPPVNRRSSRLLPSVEDGSDIAHIQNLLDDMGLLHEISRNPLSTYQYNNQSVNSVEIKLVTNQLTLFIALRLHYIAQGLDNSQPFVDLDNSMKSCFKSFKESRCYFFAPKANRLQKLPETLKNRYGYS